MCSAQEALAAKFYSLDIITVHEVPLGATIPVPAEAVRLEDLESLRR